MRFFNFVTVLGLECNIRTNGEVDCHLEQPVMTSTMKCNNFSSVIVDFDYVLRLSFDNLNIFGEFGSI